MRILLSLMAVLLLLVPFSAEARDKAPDFEAVDIYGKNIKLSDYLGKIVVLEWTNHKCPFVVKHYSTGNMQKLQKESTAKDVVWISIVSSAKGNQGHLSSMRAQEIVKEKDAHSTTRIMDEDGSIGKLYNAQTTPHMYVVDKEGDLAYQGAIDDNSSFKPETVKGANNYVVAAIDALIEGNEIELPKTRPYGCSVKY